MTDQVKQETEMVGVVVSDRMNKTIVVRVDRRVRHRLYNKYMKRSTKIMAHDEGQIAKEGDKVAIHLTKPISKRKAWKLHQVIDKNIT